MATLAAAVSMLVLTPASANAYVATSGDSYGKFYFGYTGPAIQDYPGYRFHVPVMLVTRNNAISTRYQQEMEARFQIQRWYAGVGWVNAGGGTQQTWSGFASNEYSAVLGNTDVYATIQAPGYYRVVTTLLWGSAAVPNGWSGRYTGSFKFEPNQNADFGCGNNISHCANYGASSGAVYINS